MAARYWQDLATTEFDGLDRDRTVALLPVAAVEQHGPHLPVGVDAIINEGTVSRAMKLMPASVLVLPPMPVGKSNEHLAFPGTLSLCAETLIRLWTEIGECVHRAGIAKFVMVNSHGGQPQIMDIVARDLRVRLGMLAVATNLNSLGSIPDLFSPTERRHGIHGGSSETSQIMYLRGDLVRMDARRNFTSATIAWEQEYKYLRAESPGIGFGWQTQDLNPAGALGDATDADAGRGARLTELRAAGLAELVAEVIRFPLCNLKERAAR